MNAEHPRRIAHICRELWPHAVRLSGNGISVRLNGFILDDQRDGRVIEAVLYRTDQTAVTIPILFGAEVWRPQPFELAVGRIQEAVLSNQPTTDRPLQ
jgi:hypothetical protein